MSNFEGSGRTKRLVQKRVDQLSLDAQVLTTVTEHSYYEECDVDHVVSFMHDTFQHVLVLGVTKNVYDPILNECVNIFTKDAKTKSALLNWSESLANDQNLSNYAVDLLNNINCINDYDIESIDDFYLVPNIVYKQFNLEYLDAILVNLYMHLKYNPGTGGVNYICYGVFVY
jgi:hypothetical protein